MASRCVVVLGLPRSGTSLVAGLLHEMGVSMGDDLQPADLNNPRGYFEDLRWQALNKQVTGPRYGTHEPEVISARQAAEWRALAERCANQRLWGMKDPRLCFTFNWVREALGAADVEIRVVAVYRQPAAIVASLMKHSERSYRGQYRMDLDAATALCNTWEIAMACRLKAWHGPLLKVEYEQVLASPPGEINSLATFAFHDTGRHADVRDVMAAIAFVDRGLNHAGA